MTINNDSYDISTNSNKTTALIKENNIISATLYITGTPQNEGTKFSGTTTIELDASQVALNKITQNNYLQLDGSEMSYLSSTSSDSFDSDTGFTMEAWLQTTNKGTQQIIMSYGSESSESTFSPMFSINDSDQLELSWSTNSESQKSDSLSSSNLWDSNWHHVAVSVSSTKVTFYLDGLEKGTTTISSKLSGGGTTFNIGGIDGQTFYFTGKLTDIRVWNVTRTTAEIQQYMNVDLGVETGLLELWNFTGDADKPVNKVNTSQVGSLLNEAEVLQQSVASSIVYVNFLTTDITTLQLKVTSDLSDESLEADFNSAFTSLLSTQVIPYAQQIKLNLNFGVFNLVVKPTHWNFATIDNDNTSD